MPTYEQRIDGFAQGKSLLRLARPIRNRADAFCDACGSAQARKLYALAELETERHYFVGETCLKELAKRGVVLRRFGRESGQVAYVREMNLRSQDQAKVETNPTGTEAPGSSGVPEPMISTKVSTGVSNGGKPAPKRGWDELFSPVSLVWETPEYYQAVVSIVASGGKAVFTGRAQEERYEEVWSTGGEGGLILEKARRERREAALVCLQRAWAEAKSRLDDKEADIGVDQPIDPLVQLLLPLLQPGRAQWAGLPNDA